MTVKTETLFINFIFIQLLRFSFIEFYIYVRNTYIQHAFVLYTIPHHTPVYKSCTHCIQLTSDNCDKIICLVEILY